MPSDKIKEKDITFVNTNKQIVALSAGQLDPKRPQELLFIGSETNLQVFGKFQISINKIVLILLTMLVVAGRCYVQ